MNGLRFLACIFALAAFAGGGAPVFAQGQRAAEGADLSVARPAHARGTGPRVVVDQGHNNTHRIDGLYRPFAEVLRNDGFRVSARDGPISAASLAGADILVIVNPIARENVDNWRLPTPPAFTMAEVAAVRAWVERGGRLFLLVDHMPVPGAVAPLAVAFGFHIDNGFAIRGNGDENAPDIFSIQAGSLADNEVTRGGPHDPPVTSVRSFIGSAFTAPPGALPLMKLDASWTIALPRVAWQFPDGTPMVSGRDRLQGAALSVGRGRVVVIGEAAMFTSQVQDGDVPIGLGVAGAEQNKQFLLNIMHWLAPTG